MISYIITSKNEPYLEKTIDDLEKNSRAEHEILAKEDDGRGQRAMINKLVGESKGDIICKVDAHCSFGPGFDEILLEDLQPRMVLAPLLFPLDGETWTVSHHNKMGNFAFDRKFVMHHVPGTGESMCMQGSFFMCYKDFFLEADLCDESLGSWGCQGVELAQAWYNDGICYISPRTYYGHVFRHKDDEFPYERDQREIDKTYERFTKKFRKNDIGWLVERFNHPLDWHE